jgi:hypothetical protein
MPLPPALLDRSLWDALHETAAERLASELVLPAGWRFLRAEPVSAGEQHRVVAFFAWNDQEFALIPGGTMWLGYDPAYPPELTAEDLEAWAFAEYEYGELHAHLAKTTTPVREVQIPPFLMEVQSREMDTMPNWIDGRQVGTRTINITVREVREWATADGFRLPASDEWEYACRAGTRSFWWWGNRLEFPLPARNAFGLDIALDTYRSEWCTDPDIFRGGDGGTACCGGLDGLPTAVRLASAYFQPADWKSEEEPFMGSCRRIFPLAS